MDDFRSANARRQVSDITLADIILMRDSLSETPDAANNWLKVMAVVLRYAKRTGFLAENPLADGLEKLPPKRPGGRKLKGQKGRMRPPLLTSQSCQNSPRLWPWCRSIGRRFWRLSSVA
jgi:hypothetical protein